jgi:hypothetical protein
LQYVTDSHVRGWLCTKAARTTYHPLPLVDVHGHHLMEETMDLPGSLTEAQARSRTRVTIARTEASESNARAVPYADYYRDRSAVMETPTERLQRATEEQDEPAEAS